MLLISVTWLCKKTEVLLKRMSGFFSSQKEKEKNMRIRIEFAATEFHLMTNKIDVPKC